jgi:hypothetical protein
VGGDADEAAGPERDRLPAHGELDLAVEHHVELLLALVVVRLAGVAAGHHDRVDAELLHAEGGADLAEAGALAEVADGRRRPAVPRPYVSHASAY